MAWPLVVNFGASTLRHAFFLSLGIWIVQLSLTLVGRVLLALGIGFGVYTGVGELLDVWRGYIQGNEAQLYSAVTDILAMAGVWEAFGLATGGIVGKLTIAGLNWAEGALYRFKLGAPEAGMVQ